MHLADIAPSIFSTLGLPGTRNPLGISPSPSGRECLFLIEGLGASVIDEYRNALPTISKMHSFSPLQSTFPTTTATALTTFTTGELPGTHGMLGYTVRVPRSGGRILNALNWDERVDPENWQPVETLFQRAARMGISVSHIAAKRYENSGFTRATFRGAHYRRANILADLVDETKKALKNSSAFAYVYINDLDVAGHSDGVGSEKWLDALAYVELVASSLISNLPKGTRLWLTADHGMINAEEKIIIGANNPLLDRVALIAGEPRARHLYLPSDQVDRAEEVAQTWRDFLGERADIYTQDEAITASLFGDVVTSDARDRMGDVLAIAKGTMVFIEAGRKEKESKMVGHHGGLSDAEKLIPLLSCEVH